MAHHNTLEDFKTDINLVEFAASYGFALEKRETSRNSVVMRHPGGDKIIVARAAHGHWVYFSVRDDADNGTIIDFIQHRKPGATLEHVRRVLAAWSGAVNVPRFDLPDMKLVSKDRAGVLRNWGWMSDAASHAYLEARGLSPHLLASDRFAGTLRIDARRNAVFPHRDDDGVCGYEIKNRGFTGFAPGGVKVLWLSNRKPDESVLVVAESAIDALIRPVRLLGSMHTPQARTPESAAFPPNCGCLQRGTGYASVSAKAECSDAISLCCRVTK